MWNDLNMHDRHKFIRLAVTNGVYDLDTIHDLYDRNPNMYATGGETTIQPQIPTDPNRPQIDVQPIIDRRRANNLAKYAMRDSALQQIQDLTNKVYEDEIKRRTMAWLNPSNYTDKEDMVSALRVPVAEARPTFINTYDIGGIFDKRRGNEKKKEEFEQMGATKNGVLPENENNEEVINVDNLHEWKRIHWGEYDKAPTGNKMYGDVYTINRPEQYDTNKKRLDLRHRIKDEFGKNIIIYQKRPLFKKYLLGENRGKYKPLNVTGFRVPKEKQEPVNLKIDISYTPTIESSSYKYILPQKTKIPLSEHNYEEDYWGEGSLNIPDYDKYDSDYDIYNNYILKHYIHLKSLDEVNSFLNRYKKFPVNTLEYNGLFDQNSIYDGKEAWYGRDYRVNPINTFYYNSENMYQGYYIPNDFFINQRNNEPRIGRLERITPLTINNIPTYNVTTYDLSKP